MKLHSRDDCKACRKLLHHHYEKERTSDAALSAERTKESGQLSFAKIARGVLRTKGT
jgi:hypothetical protein